MTNTARCLSAIGWLWLSCTAAPSESGRTESGIYFESTGRGAPVVLAHGFTLDRRMWANEVRTLSARYRVIVYDSRGHGLSDPWTDSFSAVQDMLGVFDASGVERATVVGLSAGAQVAIDFALAHPDRLEALVLASPGLGGYQPVGAFEWMTPVMEELQAGNPQEAMRAWTETPLMRISGGNTADSIMRSIVLENWEIWTYDPQLQQAPDPPAITRLEEITAPTLVLVGENDLIDTRHVGDTLAARLVNAQLVTVAGAGHLLNLEAPGRFLEALDAFLARGTAENAVGRSGG